MLDDLRQTQDDSSIHTIEKRTSKKMSGSVTQRRRDECVCSSVEMKCMSSPVQVTRTCKRHVTSSLFKNKNFYMEKEKSKTQKSVMSNLVNLRRSDGDYWFCSILLEWNIIFDISLTHKHSFVSIWVSYKSITCCQDTHDDQSTWSLLLQHESRTWSSLSGSYFRFVLSDKIRRQSSRMLAEGYSSIRFSHPDVKLRSIVTCHRIYPMYQRSRLSVTTIELWMKLLEDILRW